MGEFNGMPYKSLGGSGLKVSSVGLGTWKFGYPETGDASRVGREEAFRIFDRALELGVTFWDTANRYNFGTGNSERVLGEWFAAHPESRRDIVLATKLAGEMDGKTPNHAGLSRTNIIESVYASMDRMNLDYIDLLYFHWPDPTTPLEESLEAVEDLVREDIVRYFAVSNYTVDGIREILRISGQMSRRCRPVAIQNRYDIIAKEAADKPGVLSLCAEEGLSYIAWSPLPADCSPAAITILPPSVPVTVWWMKTPLPPTARRCLKSSAPSRRSPPQRAFPCLSSPFPI